MADSGTDPKIKAALQKLFSALKHRYLLLFLQARSCEPFCQTTGTREHMHANWGTVLESLCHCLPFAAARLNSEMQRPAISGSRYIEKQYCTP
jgi:hypothetical protein